MPKVYEQNHSPHKAFTVVKTTKSTFCHWNLYMHFSRQATHDSIDVPLIRTSAGMLIVCLYKTL